MREPRTLLAEGGEAHERGKANHDETFHRGRNTQSEIGKCERPQSVQGEAEAEASKGRDGEAEESQEQAAVPQKPRMKKRPQRRPSDETI